MSLIKLKTSDHRLIMLASPLLVSGSKAADVIQVEFDESWDYGEDTERFIQFVRDSEIYTYELHENKATVPQEVLLSPGRFSFAVFSKSDDRVIKTSNYCTAAVLKGADTDDVILIDWNMFFLRLVNAINDHFEKDLKDTIDTDDLIDEIGSIQTAKEMKQIFIDMLNPYFASALSIDDSTEQIAFQIAYYMDQYIHSGERALAGITADLKDISDRYVTDPSTMGDPAYINYLMDIRGFCVITANFFLELYGEV